MGHADADDPRAADAEADLEPEPEQAETSLHDEVHSREPAGETAAELDVPESGVDAAIVAEFEAALAEARKKADENWDLYLRAEAELDNERKRAERRKEDALAQQRRDLLCSFLDALDSLERALAHGEGDAQAVVEGVEATYRELSRFLTKVGVASIAALDEPFDPEVHEAVGVVAIPDSEEERVVAVDRQGYTLDGELLRPARVVVGQPAKPEPEDDDGESAG